MEKQMVLYMNQPLFCQRITWISVSLLVTFVGWMVFEIEGLEGISCSKQIKYLTGNIWVYANEE